jgi:uncharacterized membrane protein
MNETREETQQRLIHRLEAFSDIIIGFSLAQLALSLAIPKNGAAGLLENSAPLIAFGLTFTLVCGMWWAHHRLFVHYFVPIPVMVILNFVTLAGVSFSVYSVQLMLHARHTSIDFAFYEWSLSAVYVLLAVQYFYGWTVRRKLVPEDVAEGGLRSALMLAGVGIGFGLIAVVTLRYGVRVSGLQYIGYLIVAYAIGLRLFFRFRRARAADRPGP